jgi:hypothetical protein
MTEKPKIEYRKTTEEDMDTNMFCNGTVRIMHTWKKDKLGNLWNKVKWYKKIFVRPKEENNFKAYYYDHLMTKLVCARNYQVREKVYFCRIGDLVKISGCDMVMQGTKKEWFTYIEISKIDIVKKSDKNLALGTNIVVEKATIENI